MVDKEVHFEIAGISFAYLYHFEMDYIEESTIRNFLISNSSTDIINHIFHINDAIDLDDKGEAIYHTPAWTWHEKGNRITAVFHPDEHFIGLICFTKEDYIYTTYVTQEEYFPQILPIAMTGFILQQELNKKKKGFIMHGATVIHEGRAIVLTGSSGVGKTTLSQMLIKHKEFSLLTDDRIIIRQEEGQLVIYGNPFDRKNHECKNQKERLYEIILLKHGKDNVLQQYSKEEACRKLLTISLLPYGHAENLLTSVDLLQTISKTIPVRELSFRLEPQTTEFFKEYLL